MEVQSCYHQNTLPAQIVWSLSRREGCNYHQRVVEPHSCCRVVSNIFWNFQPWNPWEFMISNLTLRFAHMCFLNWNVETTKRPDANWIFTRFLVGWHICSLNVRIFKIEIGSFLNPKSWYYTTARIFLKNGRFWTHTLENTVFINHQTRSRVFKYHSFRCILNNRGWASLVATTHDTPRQFFDENGAKTRLLVPVAPILRTGIIWSIRWFLSHSIHLWYISPTSIHGWFLLGFPCS